MRKPFMPFVLLLASVLLCLSASTPSAGDLWPKEPKEFKGVPFGASLQETREILHLDQTPYAQDCNFYEPTGEGECRDTFRIGNALMKGNYKFVKNRLVSIYISFLSSDFDYLKDIFIEKYGKPSQVNQQTESTAFGATYKNESLRWQGSTLILGMDHYSSTVEKGSIYFALIAELERLKQEAEKGKKDALKDF